MYHQIVLHKLFLSECKSNIVDASMDIENSANINKRSNRQPSISSSFTIDNLGTKKLKGNDQITGVRKAIGIL